MVWRQQGLGKENAMNWVQRLIPLSDWVLVSLDAQGEREENGIIIPDVGATRMRTGTVLAVGPDCVEISKKNTIIIDSYDEAISEVADNVVMVRESRVLAKQ
jgi:co-chaperonin GroES (HSP10)